MYGGQSSGIYNLSCNQYICCTDMQYEEIFALFVLDE